VTFNSRGKTSLQVSWKTPEESLQNVELTGYQVCFYTKDTVPECLVLAGLSTISTKVLSLTLNNLQPSTKYFVTVSASTKAGFGEKSLAINKITSGGNSVNMNIVGIYFRRVHPFGQTSHGLRLDNKNCGFQKTKQCNRTRRI
jgi:hypothetical protein